MNNYGSHFESQPETSTIGSLGAYANRGTAVGSASTHWDGEMFFTAILDANPDAIVVLNANNQRIFSNQAADAMFGHNALNGDLSYLLKRGNIRLDRKSGARFVEPRWNLLRSPFGPVAIVSLRDVTRVTRHMRRLREESMTDALTGLFNRRGFLAVGKLNLKLAAREGRHSQLLIIDVDGLKRINDVHGHPAGDECIAAVGKVLKETFRQSDLIARLGGDEFAVLSTAPESSNWDELIRRLQDNIEKLNNNSVRPYKVSVSCGASQASGGDSLEDIYDRADREMYKVKARR